ncbi:MAG: sulfatase-like hydrolase/transferase, partial [Planctomycetes bacterium]|nr:sulfatase-like hydrolase/transferase [Planctomycetota bacterium]
MAVLLGTVPSFFSAWRSDAYGPASYKTNTSDALTFRVAAELLADDRSPYDTQAQEAHIARTRLNGERPPYVLPFAYPPNALPLFLVYLVGSPRVAFLLFVSIGTAAMLAAAWVFSGLVIRDTATRFATVLAIGCGGAALFNGQIGQTGSYLAASVFAYAAFYQRRPMAAGIALGLMAFKPQYALPMGIVALVEGRWKTVLSAGATLLVSTVVSGLLFGFDMWSEFLVAVREPNHTWKYMCSWFAPFTAMGIGELVKTAEFPVMFLGAAAIGVVSRLGEGGPDRSLRNLAFAAVIAPLVSANTHPYDLTIVILAVLVFSADRRDVTKLLCVTMYGVGLLVMLQTGHRWLITLLTAAVPGLWVLARRRHGARDGVAAEAIGSLTQPLRPISPIRLAREDAARSPSRTPLLGGGLARIGLFLALTLAVFDVLVGSVLSHEGRLPAGIVLAELATSGVAFLLLYSVAAAATCLVSARSRRGESPGTLPRIAMYLGGLAAMPPLGRSVFALLSWFNPADQLIVVLLAAAMPVFVHFAVRRLRESATSADNRAGLVLSVPVVLLAVLALLVIQSNSPLVGPAFGVLGLWIGLFAITIAAIWRLRRSPSVRGMAAACAALCGLVALSGLGTLSPATALAAADESVSNAPTIKRVILLTVDTLRADALRVYSDGAPPTPNLSALAADSVVFDEAVSPAPWTLPAFSSIMTGLSPTVHQAIRSTSRLPDVPTLAERMRASGYRTAAIGKNPYLLPLFGLSRGFERYEMYPAPGGRSLGRALLGWAFPERFALDVTTDGITRKAVRWLTENRERRFFLWLHYFDPHVPYEPPSAYLPKSTPPERIGTSFEDTARLREGYFVPTREEIEWLRGLYHAEVRYVDDNIGVLMAALKRLGIYEETLIVFTSDHGEEFAEHGGYDHGHTLYDELVRVPLFVKG